ncbi:DOMON-like domain-containing protein [Azonexus sp.]|uniref:DOMON-like domain-containing protein n=1 Tax=Azonexus sp. TaxID=1872668 RepID=UPI0035B4EC7C
MIFHPLLQHAASPPPAGLMIAVTASRGAAGELQLDYRLHGVTILALPPPAVAGPADGLWQHTCCEAFIAVADGPAYREFNFAPSGQWAVYDFADYRQRNESWQPPAAPQISCRRDGDTLYLMATVPAALLPANAARLGLSVVAATPAGDRSYWALAHAAAQPDFHLAASFVLPLP